MTSIFENTSSPVTIHLLHDETLTQDNREKFIRTAEKYSQEIDFIDMAEYRESFTDEVKKFSKHLTIAAFYRTFIPQVLSNLDKVIYFDCDVVANLDISELWNIDLENKSLGGVLDQIADENSLPLVRTMQLKLCGLEKKNYINSGVLLMNIKKINAGGNFFKRIINWLEHYKSFTATVDQDAINANLAGDIKILDSRFNVWVLSRDLSNSIIHMWAGKPWKKFTGAKHEKLYWQMYFKSAWGENCTDIMDKISVVVALFTNNFANNPYLHKHGSQCVKRLLCVIPNRFKKVLEPLKLRLKYYCVKYKFSR